MKLGVGMAKTGKEENPLVEIAKKDEFKEQIDDKSIEALMSLYSDPYYQQSLILYTINSAIYLGTEKIIAEKGTSKELEATKASSGIEREAARQMMEGRAAEATKDLEDKIPIYKIINRHLKELEDGIKKELDNPTPVKETSFIEGSLTVPLIASNHTQSMKTRA